MSRMLMLLGFFLGRETHSYRGLTRCVGRIRRAREGRLCRNCREGSAKRSIGGGCRVPENHTEAKKPSLMCGVPPVFLLNCACDCICVKHYSPRIEQPYLDRIKRFIHFLGKRRRPGSGPTFGAQAECLIARSWPTCINLCPQWSADRYGGSWPISAGRARSAPSASAGSIRGR